MLRLSLLTDLPIYDPENEKQKDWYYYYFTGDGHVFEKILWYTVTIYHFNCKWSMEFEKMLLSSYPRSSAMGQLEEYEYYSYIDDLVTESLLRAWLHIDYIAPADIMAAGR